MFIKKILIKFYRLIVLGEYSKKLHPTTEKEKVLIKEFLSDISGIKPLNSKYTNNSWIDNVNHFLELAKTKDDLVEVQGNLHSMGYLIFFSSRRRHTRWTGDWSSDVCSSDLQR